MEDLARVGFSHEKQSCAQPCICRAGGTVSLGHSSWFWSGTTSDFSASATHGRAHASRSRTPAKCPVLHSGRGNAGRANTHGAARFRYGRWYTHGGHPRWYTRWYTRRYTPAGHPSGQTVGHSYDTAYDTSLTPTLGLAVRIGALILGVALLDMTPGDLPVGPISTACGAGA